jgi:predicted PurR-regulated permease PerM
MPTLPTFTRYVFVVVAVLLLAVLVVKLAPVLMLAFAGIVLAAAVRAGAAPLERRLRFGRTWAVLAVVLVVLAFVGGVIFFFGVQLAKQMQDLVEAVTDAWEKLRGWIEDKPFGATLLDNADALQDPKAVASVAKGTVTVFGGIADLALVIMLTIYLAADPTTYRNGALALLPPRLRGDVGEAFDACGDALRRWLLGQLVAMVCVGLCIAIGLALIGVPLAAALGLLSGLLEFVPYIGPILGIVPGVLVAFASGPQMALYALGVYVVVLFIEGNVIVPMVQKWALELPPALTLFAIVVAGVLFGILGLLFAVPLTIVVLILTQRLYVARIEKTRA